MPRKNLSSLLIFVALLAWPLTGRGLDAAEWKNRQSLSVDRAGVLRLVLPPATLDAARPGLEDLRLADSTGRETPFLIIRAAPTSAPANRAPRAFRTSLTSDATQLDIETGTDAPIATLTLATPANAFLKAARVEISTDRQQWETLQAGAPLFRQFGAEQLQIDLGRRSAAHIRITIDDTRTRPVPFTGAALAFGGAGKPAPAEPLPEARLAHREEFSGESVLTLDLGAQNVPLAALDFTTTEPLFARSISVTSRELRDDNPVERTLARGSIYRLAADGLPATARLDLPLEFRAPARELLIHIANGDSPPLAVDELRVTQHPVWLVFRAAAPGTYSLLTGNPDVAAPRYDLSTFTTALTDATTSALAPGAIETNPSYRRRDALADTPLLGARLDPSAWRYRKAVKLTVAGVQQLELDPDVLASSQVGLADLRLIREGVQVPYLVERTALMRLTPLTLQAAADPKKPPFSRWAIKLPRAHLPLARVTLSSSTPFFQRQLRCFEIISDDRVGSRERTLADASWSQTPGHDTTLTFALPGSAAGDTLWLETDNGDNPPITITSVKGSYPVTRLLFRSDAAPLVLYYGNRDATAPRYDVTLVAPQIIAAEKHVASLEAEEQAKHDGWAATALTGRRASAVFWGVLALVVVGLLVVVAKLLPKPPATTRQP